MITFNAVVVIMDQAFTIHGASPEVFGRWFSELIERYYGGDRGRTLPAPDIRQLYVLDSEYPR